MRTILVVEDDETLAYATAKHLEHSGYMVLIDIVMPKGQPHGLALARMARMKREGTKTAFMTGYHDLGIDESDMGTVFYKPLDLELLTTTIDGIFLGPESQLSPGAK